MQLFKSWPLFALLLLCGNLAFGQANTSLSNLVAPTAINADLMFGSSGYNIGSGSFPANNLYANNMYAGTLYAVTSIGSSTTPISNAYIGIIQPGGSVLNGENIDIIGGTPGSGHDGGPVRLFGGAATTGTGGQINIYSGTGVTNGDIYIGMPNSTATEGQIRVIGHFGWESGGAPSPSVSNCGTGANMAGSDSAGYINVGSSTSTCTLNFGYAYNTRVVCTVSDETARVALKVVPTSASMIVSAAANYAVGTVLDYICVGAN